MACQPPSQGRNFQQRERHFVRSSQSTERRDCSTKTDSAAAQRLSRVPRTRTQPILPTTAGLPKSCKPVRNGDEQWAANDGCPTTVDSTFPPYSMFNANRLQISLGLGYFRVMSRRRKAMHNDIKGTPSSSGDILIHFAHNLSCSTARWRIGGCKSRNRAAD